MLQQELGKFFGVEFPELWEAIATAPQEKIRVFKHGDLLGFCYVESDDLSGNGEGMQPYLLFDDVMRKEHLESLRALPEHFPELVWVDNGVPKLMFDLSIPLEKHLERVKAKPSIISGERWAALSRRTFRPTEEELERIFQEKALKYPDLDTKFVEFVRRYDKGQWLVHEANTQEGEVVYTQLCVHSDTRLYGVLVNVSGNPEVNKKYKPSILCHTDTLRLGYELGVPTVDFGFQFPYKNIIAEPTWYGGLRWNRQEGESDARR